VKLKLKPLLQSSVTNDPYDVKTVVLLEINILFQDSLKNKVQNKSILQFLVTI